MPLEVCDDVTVEVTVNGLILWRMRRSPDEQLWCTVRDRTDEKGGGLVLTVQDPGKLRTATAKECANVQSVVDVADRLRDQLTTAGWHVVDVDLDEPD